MPDYSIIMDPHIHSVASGHGSADTVTDIIKEVFTYKKGLSLIGITDHGPAYPGSCKSSYFRNISMAPRKRFGIHICYGCEVNILDNKGSLDLDSDILRRLDYNIASLHTKCLVPKDITYHTEAYINAMQNPYIHIIGHCDDTSFPVDYQVLVKEAKSRHVLLEINESSLSPNGYRGNVKENVSEILRWCKIYEHPVVLSSDSHGKTNAGNMEYAAAALEQAAFPSTLVLNQDPDKFMAFVRNK